MHFSFQKMLTSFSYIVFRHLYCSILGNIQLMLMVYLPDLCHMFSYLQSIKQHDLRTLNSEVLSIQHCVCLNAKIKMLVSFMTLDGHLQPSQDFRFSPEMSSHVGRISCLALSVMQKQILTLLVRRSQKAACIVSGFIKWLTSPSLGNCFHQGGRGNLVERMVFPSVKTRNFALVIALRVGFYVRTDQSELFLFFLRLFYTSPCCGFQPPEGVGAIQGVSWTSRFLSLLHRMEKLLIPSWKGFFIIHIQPLYTYFPLEISKNF